MSFCRTLFLSALILSVFLVSSAQVPAAPAYSSDPKFLAAMAEGKELGRQHNYLFELEAYKKANKIARGACWGCLTKIYELQMGMRNYKDAVATAVQLETVGATPDERSIAQGDRGVALLMQGGDKPKPAQLEAAHEAFQSALTSFPKNNSARYRDACVLAQLGKNDDASKEFAACADAAAPTDPTRQRARHFAENPALSLSKMAPAFEVTALDGTKFSLDAMQGHVVLIDFWATWCGPCKEELPHVKKIAKDFAGQPLTIISISWDSDEAKWKDFISKNEMTWLQYRDGDHKLSERFGVNAIPHYFTIDSDGVLTAEMLGSGSDVEGKLKKLLKRAREAKASETTQASLESGAK
jgi:thiol-disulfide isomerase/thioredoxin